MSKETPTREPYVIGCVGENTMGLKRFAVVGPTATGLRRSSLYKAKERRDLLNAAYSAGLHAHDQGKMTDEQIERLADWIPRHYNIAFGGVQAGIAQALFHIRDNGYLGVSSDVVEAAKELARCAKGEHYYIEGRHTKCDLCNSIAAWDRALDGQGQKGEGADQAVIKALKALRNYFGENDKTPAEHRMFTIADQALDLLTPNPSSK